MLVQTVRGNRDNWSGTEGTVTFWEPEGPEAGRVLFTCEDLEGYEFEAVYSAWLDIDGRKLSPEILSPFYRIYGNAWRDDCLLLLETERDNGEARTKEQIVLAAARRFWNTI